MKRNWLLGMLVGSLALVLVLGPTGASLHQACTRKDVGAARAIARCGPASENLSDSAGGEYRGLPEALAETGGPPYDASLLAAAEKETDLDRKGAVLEQAAASVADNALAAALGALVNQRSPEAAELRRLLMRRWAAADPAAAAAWTQRLPEETGRDLIEQVAIAWADSDLDKAVSWAEALPAGAVAQGAALGVAYEAARTSPAVALDLACGLPPSNSRDDLLVHAASQWAGMDPAAAVAWADQVPDAELRQRLLAAMAVGCAKQDPSGAAALVALSLSAGAEQNRAAVAVAQRWAQSSPQEAAAWVQQFPDASLRAAAGESLRALSAEPEALTPGP